MTADELIAAIRSAAVTAIRYRGLRVGPHLLEYGWLDLRDGDSHPRIIQDLLTLDLWFLAGTFPGVQPLETRTVTRTQDGLFTPAGVYRWERHTVQVVDPEPLPVSDVAPGR